MENIDFVENLVDLIMKTLSSSVFNGYRDNLGVKYVLSMF